jgi:hypothetical protein
VAASQLRNRRDGITGLLYSDGRRFLQVVEGPTNAIESLLTRLGKDRRHRAIVTLSRRTIERREFGDWAMAMMRDGEDNFSFAARIKALCDNADLRVLGTFLGLVEARSAARA